VNTKAPHWRYSLPRWPHIGAAIYRLRASLQCVKQRRDWQTSVVHYNMTISSVIVARVKVNWNTRNTSWNKIRQCYL